VFLSFNRLCFDRITVDRCCYASSVHQENHGPERVAAGEGDWRRAGAGQRALFRPGQLWQHVLLQLGRPGALLLPAVSRPGAGVPAGAQAAPVPQGEPADVSGRLVSQHRVAEAARRNCGAQKVCGSVEKGEYMCFTYICKTSMYHST